MTVWNTEVTLQYYHFIISALFNRSFSYYQFYLLLANAEVWWSVKSQVVHWTIIFKNTSVPLLLKKKEEKYLMLTIEKSIFQGGVPNMFFQLWDFLQSYLFSQWQIKYVRLEKVFFFFFFFLSPPYLLRLFCNIKSAYSYCRLFLLTNILFYMQYILHHLKILLST